MVKKLLFTSVNLRIVWTVALLIVFTKINAYTAVSIDGIRYELSWNFSTNEAEAIVISGENYSGDITIPSEITYKGSTYVVRRIGLGAFKNSIKLNSVKIANSVNTISNGAFEGCSNLSSLTIPASITSISCDNTFKGCTKLSTLSIEDSKSILNFLSSGSSGAAFSDSPLSSVYLGRNISFIMKGSTTYSRPPFKNNIHIADVTFGPFVTKLDNELFEGCNHITAVYIPKTIVSIGEKAFYGCSMLSSIIVEEGNGYYDSRDNCNAIIGKKNNILILGGLETKIPKSVKEIGRFAFGGNSKLENIKIPSTIKKIGGGAFEGCKSLYKVDISNLNDWLEVDFTDNFQDGNNWYYSNPLCYGHNLYVNGELVEDLIIPNTTANLKDYVFHGCSMNSLIIPKSVTDIAESSFKDCNQLKKISIDCINVQSWFKGLKGIKELWFGESVKSIEKSAFEGCTGLDEIHFSNSIESVGQWAFNDCNGLSAIHISDIAKWCNMNFEFSSNNSKHTNPLYYAHNLYLNDHLVKECVIPYGVKEIKDFVFEGCNMESIFIPSTVIKIGSKQTFNECNNLKAVNITDLAAWCKIDFTDGNASNYIHGNPLCYAHNLYLNKELVNDLVIPSSISAIKEWTFDGCASIRSVFIPDGICTIGYGAFHNCAEMEFLSIPHTITSISNNSFSDCPKLVQLVSFSNNVLSVTNECVVLVPSSIVNRYQTGKIFPIVTDETTQSTIKLSSTEQFVLKQAACEEYNGNGAVIKKQEKNAVDGTILFSGVAPDRNHLITITGEAFGKVVSGSFVIKTKPLVINIERISATNLTIKVKGSYEGDAQVTNTNFGDYGNGIETTISNLYPGQSLIVTFNVTTSDGSVSSISKWFETIPVKANVSCKTTSSSCAMTGSYSVIDATIVSSGFQQNDYQSDMLMVHGLEPGTAYYNQYTYRVNIKEGGSVSQSVSFKTNALKMATLAPKVISLGNVIVAAETNLDDEEENVGFEWRRTDWTNDFASSTGTAVLYEGTMEGYIRNMNAEKLWKVRPYYLSNSGKYYYGDWMGLDPSNTSYFEPTVHTYAKISVVGNTALVKGYALRGTDGVKVQGFKYWKQTAGVRNRATAIPSNAITVEANGQVMTASLTDLDFESKYCYVAFVTTTEGETFYGEQLTFTTGSDPTGIENVPNGVPTVTVVARYDVNGRRIATAQSGLNILRMSDGTCCKVWVK